jgi:hypothetical protein
MQGAAFERCEIDVLHEAVHARQRLFAEKLLEELLLPANCRGMLS